MKLKKIEDYKKLSVFLSDNDLEIRSHFASTDLYCALAVYHKKHHYDSDEIDQRLFPFITSFFFQTYPDVEFNVKCTLDHQTINEESFICYLSDCLSKVSGLSEPQIIRSILKGNYTPVVFKNILKRNDSFSDILYNICALFGGKASLYAKDKLASNYISEKQIWAVSYMLSGEISDSYRTVDFVEKALTKDAK